MSRRPILIVLVKGYPRLSETFIAQEIRSLELAGFNISIMSMRQPTDKSVHPVHREIRAPVGYLPEYLHDAPIRVLKALARARRLPGYAAARSAFLDDLRRDFTRNRVRRFGQAAVLAAEMPESAAHIYAHFIHTPGSVARYASLMTGLPWSCSAHAKDIWTTPDRELADKLRETAFAVTCTRAGQDRLNALAPADKQVHLVYHGLDLARFRPLVAPAALRDGSDPETPIRFLTVARAVEKKGLDTLIEALAMLPSDLNWTWTHIGGGPLTKKLMAMVRTQGVADRCRFLGACAQEAVVAAYGTHDVFVLPCRIAEDGDRDGLPNVLMEAASQGLALVSTDVSGVTELITDGVTGIIVPESQPAALAAAMADLASDPKSRIRIARAGAQRVAGLFDHRAAVQRLIGLFPASLRGVGPAGRVAAE